MTTGADGKKIYNGNTDRNNAGRNNAVSADIRHG
jgi:hypothetical protein